MKLFSLLVAILLLASCAVSSNKNITTKIDKVTLVSPNGTSEEIDLLKITKKLQKSSLTVISNPAYKGAKKKYEGYRLIDFLKQFVPAFDASKPFWLEITTEDGWKAPIYYSGTLLSGKAMLAVREAKQTLTEPISKDGLWSIVVTEKKNFYPGPFYLVWNDKGKNPDVMPLQVSKIHLLLIKPKK